MNIFIAIILLAIFLYITLIIWDMETVHTKIMLTILILGIIWLSMGFSLYNQKKTYVAAVPVLIEGGVSFCVYKNQLVNCTEKFKTQFKPTGDSIKVFKEEDAWALGLKWNGGDFVYEMKK